MQSITDKTKIKTDVYLKELRSESRGSIIVTYPNVKWDNIVVKDQIKDVLKERIISRPKCSQNSTGTRKSHNNILLHGPPGVGKSLLIRTTVSECQGVPLIWVYLRLLIRHYSQENSTISELFDVAETCTKCVIVLDDLDHISTTTVPDVPKIIIDRIKSELTSKILDTQVKDDMDTFIIAVTNKSWEVETSIIECFDDRLYILLPTATERSALLQMFFRVKTHELTKEDFTQFGEKSDGFSGNDILAISREILMEQSRRVRHASYFKQVSNWCNVSSCFKLMWTPCLADDVNAVFKSWTDIDSDEILEPVITFDTVLAVIGRSQPSVSVDEVRKH